MAQLERKKLVKKVYEIFSITLRAPKLPWPNLNVQSAVHSFSCVVASAVGALPVRQPGLTAGAGWDEVHANRLPPVCGIQ